MGEPAAQAAGAEAPGPAGTPDAPDASAEDAAVDEALLELFAPPKAERDDESLGVRMLWHRSLTGPL